MRLQIIIISKYLAMADLGPVCFLRSMISSWLLVERLEEEEGSRPGLDGSVSHLSRTELSLGWYLSY